MCRVRVRMWGSSQVCGSPFEVPMGAQYFGTILIINEILLSGNAHVHTATSLRPS